jgi:hypothetical protein
LFQAGIIEEMMDDAMETLEDEVKTKTKTLSWTNISYSCNSEEKLFFPRNYTKMVQIQSQAIAINQ